jgi:hypothetical protein
MASTPRTNSRPGHFRDSETEPVFGIPFSAMLGFCQINRTLPTKINLAGKPLN